MFKNAFEMFEQGLRRQEQEEDRLMFQNQLDDILKIKEILKQEFLNSMSRVKFNDSDKRIRIEVTENGQHFDSKLMTDRRNTDDDKQSGDESARKSFVLKKATASYDFLGLKNIEGKVIEHVDHVKIDDNNDEVKGSDRVVHFASEDSHKLISRKSLRKGILKRRDRTNSSNRESINSLATSEGLDELD